MAEVDTSGQSRLRWQSASMQKLTLESPAVKRACRSSLAATRAESGPPSGSTLRSIERSSSTAALIRSAWESPLQRSICV